MNTTDRKLECVLVNKFVKKNSNRLVMHTWFDGEIRAGFTECDAHTLLSGEARNEDWLTMDENLKACSIHYSKIPRNELVEQPVFKVRIEFEKNEDYSFKWAKAIEQGF